MMDSGGLILAFNQAAEHTFDFSRDEVLGRELTETMHWSGWPAGCGGRGGRRVRGAQR
jgi:PAS domain-containing protein